MLIELDRVTRLYGIVIGVNDICLSLPTGAHGLLGPNGAGKTTLLNLITGQLKPTIGSIRVLGSRPGNDPELLRRIGYLPGNEGMYADVSAIEWVTYLTRIQGYSAREADRLARQALERVKLTEHMHRKISTYSRGMRQRARLAQAIAHEPEFLILDEPFNGLDPIARHAMTTMLRQWIAEDRSLLVSSHVLHEIESLTHSFLLISGGRLLASGSTEEMGSLLTAVPAEIRLRLDDPRGLAAELIRERLAESVRVVSEDELLLTTASSLELGQHLVQEAAAGRYQIREMRAADDSLQEVFSSLMKIHRGQA
ncbi:MAG: ABC transporter ATP-binding protein [Planctomycetaceae bacterium]|nr:MAG: ABC transporter ATP-binding protein [Planctomycetaceae bacterium]